MKRHWLIILLLSLGLNVGLGLGVLRRELGPPPPPQEAWNPAEAHSKPPTRDMARHFMGKRLERMTRKLHLDGEQRVSLEELYQATSDAIFTRRGAMGAARAAMQERVMQTEDPDLVRQMLAEHARMQAELDSIVVNVMLQERAIMHEDQLEGYREFMLPLGGGRGREGRDGRGGRKGRFHEARDGESPGR